MTAEEAAEIVRMALAEAGFPKAEVTVALRSDGLMGVGFPRDEVPPLTAYRAFAVLFHARKLPFPDTFDEWWDAPTAWWHVPFDEPVSA